MNLLQQLTAISTPRSQQSRKSWEKALSIAHETHRNRPVAVFEPLMKGKGWMTTRSLSEQTGRDPCSVNLSLRKLIKMGLVARVQDGRSAEAWRKKVWLYMWIEEKT